MNGPPPAHFEAVVSMYAEIDAALRETGHRKGILGFRRTPYADEARGWDEPGDPAAEAVDKVLAAKGFQAPWELGTLGRGEMP